MYNNNYYPQQQPPYQQTQLRGLPPQQLFLKGRPVTSLEEAKASAIDFDGSVFYFPDLGNKRIYTKQINIDGTSSLNMYELREMPIEEIGGNPSTLMNFVTKDELSNILNQFKQELFQGGKTVNEQQPKYEF